ncbi:MAG: PTS glucose transporter subunit IIA [Erysipelotrichaceae bacterium]|nr:PTS glucose transporter subunit IIA [Erysipelotrichaceae bacterium]MCH4045058.1 PTS glucose transporter subunit IIA [Erysipelotrichaceae bacterium]MCH4122269.1 PTS glucose transporter subunit IIA [Erysipelotrichaceae bacterium]
MALFNRFKKDIPTIADDLIVAPADGVMFDIEKVSDPVFAKKTMGDGVAFKFYGNKVDVCAPANGELTAMFPTGHAFGITMKNGVEVLVHIGIDTVEANGKGFKAHKKRGALIKAGEPIVSVNFDELSKTYDMSTMLIITNAMGQNIHFTVAGEVKKGQPVIQ